MAIMGFKLKNPRNAQEKARIEEVNKKYIEIYSYLDKTDFERYIIQPVKNITYSINNEYVDYRDYTEWLTDKQINFLKTKPLPYIPNSLEFSKLLYKIQDNIHHSFKDIPFKVTADACSFFSKYFGGTYNIILELTDTIKGNDRLNVYCDKDTKFSMQKDNSDEIIPLQSTEVEKYIVDKRVDVVGTISFYPGYGKMQITATHVKIRPEVSKFQKQLDIWKKEIEHLIEEHPDFKTKLELRSVYNIGIISSKGFGYDDFTCNIKRSLKDVKFFIKQGLSLNELINSIREFNTEKTVDCICIIRGGGDKYTFLDFYNPKLIQTMIQSDIPILTGIGHEANVPYCCNFSFYNLGTPTALAKYLISIRSAKLNQKNIERLSKLSDMVDDLNQKALSQNAVLLKENFSLHKQLGALKLENKAILSENHILQETNKQLAEIQSENTTLQKSLKEAEMALEVLRKELSLALFDNQKLKDKLDNTNTGFFGKIFK